MVALACRAQPASSSRLNRLPELHALAKSGLRRHPHPPILRSRICSISAAAQKKLLLQIHPTRVNIHKLVNAYTYNFRNWQAWYKSKPQWLLPLGHGALVPKVLRLLRCWRSHFNDFPPFGWWWCEPQLSSLWIGRMTMVLSRLLPPLCSNRRFVFVSCR